MASLSIARSPFFLILSFAVLLLHSCYADPDPLQDFCVANLEAQNISVNGFTCKPSSTVTSDDFFFAGLAKEGDTGNIFGLNVSSGDVLNFPGLNTLGVSMNRVDLAPGGTNPPHSHPRATELVFVIDGRVLVGFVTTSNALFSKVLNAGESFVIPKGLIHFQFNVGVGKALLITAFDSQLPGVQIIPVALFASSPSIPNQVLAKAFQVDEQIVKGIKSKFGSS
ncbi:germin-like protein subfamily T member 1 [Tasmannia lanceolata]|uniref:germin-like protein subfamily T member 1 n=1 Tax=Tasmannia lanceolata TaxID=3420 RepID=UPI00406403EC